VRSASGDRAEFLGRRAMGDPAAMARARLSGKLGAALDPCAAIQVVFELADGEDHEVVFRLGVGRNSADAASLLQRFRGPQSARDALDAVRAHWQNVLGRAGEDSGRRAQRACQRLAAVPDVACACGRAAATTSRAARSGSATSSRT